MSGQRTQWNEATRVQMPALVHLTRIGFTYFGKITEDKAGTVYDPDTNILIEVFKSQFAKLNPERAGEAEAMLRTIRQELDNDDIGESFYKRLKAVSPVRLIDFEHPENNTFHCSAEFTCKRDEDEFRPDITLFVNGLPLVFIEVKKPNNIGGMVAEAERMNKLRFPNKKFRRFINITQLMIFSNNMEYDAMGGIVPIQGVFYCTGSKKGSPFNCFREENPLNLDVAPYNRDFPYKDIDPEVEKQILSDFNNQVIHTSPEYQTNLRTTTPTNRVLTSMCSPDRLLFLLKYGITYYHKTKELDDGTIEQIDHGVVLEVSADKLGLPEAGIIDVLNVKSDPLLIGSLRGQDGYFPAYHMNKEKWLSIQLGKPELDDAIKDLLSLSHELTAPKKRNPKSSAKNPGDSANGKEKETDKG